MVYSSLLFLTGEDQSLTNPLQLQVERYLAIMNSQNQPEPAPFQAPIEASMGPSSGTVWAYLNFKTSSTWHL